MTKKVRLNEVSEPVRVFLSDALAGEGTLIADETGRACGQLMPFAMVTIAEQEGAAVLVTGGRLVTATL